jgi:Lrp/AsnC family transcriptional regulator
MHSMMAIDEFDRAILRHLQADSSFSVDELAAKVNLSRNACWRRVKRLEDEGIIKGRVALVDAAKVNAGLTVVISVRTSQHSAEWAERFRDMVRRTPEIVGAYRTAGDIDYILRARVPDVAAYDRLYKSLISKVDMMDVSASFVMEELKETTEIPLSFIG